MRSIRLGCLLLALHALPAAATDGRIEINQVCALQTGCFTGDTPGFPVTIDGVAGRAYVLSSDLVVPDADTTAIETVGALPEVVLIDLNLFSIRGPARCNVALSPGSVAVNCTTSGSGWGLLGAIFARNGQITGLGGGAAITAGEFLTASHNSGTGLQLVGCVRCSASLNGGAGFVASGAGRFESITAITNGSHGFDSSSAFNAPAVTIDGGIFGLNSGNGLRVAAGSLVHRVRAEMNELAGIYAAGVGVLIQDSDVAKFNIGPSIECAARCMVRDSAVATMTLTSDSGYANNHVGSPSVSAGVNLGGNLCSGGILCP